MKDKKHTNTHATKGNQDPSHYCWFFLWSRYITLYSISPYLVNKGKRGAADWSWVESLILCSQWRSLSQIPDSQVSSLEWMLKKAGVCVMYGWINARVNKNHFPWIRKLQTSMDGLCPTPSSCMGIYSKSKAENDNGEGGWCMWSVFNKQRALVSCGRDLSLHTSPIVTGAVDR